MKKRILLVIGVVLSAMVYANGGNNVVSIEVERKINKFYQGTDFSQRTQYINMQKKAYIEMINYIKEANIPVEEKEGILRNVESMYPNNYIMQKNEAINRVEHVKSLM